MKQLYFNSSLPRAGSTLLQNLIAQNPDFYCTPTSGTLELVYGARANFSNDPTFKAQDQETMKNGFRGFCKNGLNGFYESITDKPYVLEKSRGWGVHYDFLEFIFEEKPKIVCMVRDIKHIVASMEKKIRDSAHVDSGIINHATLANTSTPKRVDHYLNTQPLGLALERLSEIIRRGFHTDMLFIKYEDLCKNPNSVMAGFYDYVGLPKYKHNFNFIEQKTQEDDSVYGVVGDHKIKNTLKISQTDPVKILGGDICSFLDTKNKWFNDFFGYNA